MKIRTDFVTNSSSSSFVVFGVTLQKVTRGISNEGCLKLFEQGDAADWGGDENMTDAEKIDYIKDGGYFEHSKFHISSYEDGEQDIGLGINRLIKDHPANCLGSIKQLVADELNDEFGTNLTENDIDYIEEIIQN